MAHSSGSRMVSHYVRNEPYEGIAVRAGLILPTPTPAAPMSIDDQALFCCPDCRHSKMANDFIKLSPSPMARFTIRDKIRPGRSRRYCYRTTPNRGQSCEELLSSSNKDVEASTSAL